MIYSDVTVQTVERTFRNYAGRSFVSRNDMIEISTFTSMIFSLMDETGSIIAHESIKTPISYSGFNILLKNNILEIFAGLSAGLPMLRTQRSVIESLARLYLTFRINTLLNDGVPRTNKSVSVLESAITTQRVRHTLNTFADTLESFDFTNVATYFTELYTKLNENVHSDLSTAYPEYLDPFLSKLEISVHYATEIFQKELGLAVFCLLQSAQLFVSSPLLSRGEFRWLTEHSFPLSIQDFAKIS